MEEVLRYGRMMFIYDTSCCTREEDDPAEAICFLRCGGGGGRSVEPLTDELDADGAATVVDSAALHLVCQLMGTAFFTERDMAAFPSTIRLRYGQFVLHREGNFIWVMHTSGEDETYVTRAQLARTRQALGVLLGGLPALLASVGGDRARLRRRLSRTLGPLLAAAGSQPSLERVLDVLPRLNWAQKDDFIARQLCDVQMAALRVPGVLACVLCWDAKVVSIDDVEDLAETLVHIHWLPEDAFDLVDVDFVLPPGTMVARVHLDSGLYTSLRGAAESRWISPGPEKVVPSSSPSELPPLNSIDEATEPGCGGGSGTASVTSSTQDGGTDGRGKENRPSGCRRRHRHRRRHRSSPSRPESPAEDGTAVSPAADGHGDGADESESESPSVVRHRISALALQALSAECARTEPPPPPSLDGIPVRRLRRPRSGRRPRRTLTELDVPEPFSNLAFLKRRQPELYRDELRKLQASLPDNQPAFTAVSANPYSFGIPRSNRPAAGCRQPHHRPPLHPLPGEAALSCADGGAQRRPARSCPTAEPSDWSGPRGAGVDAAQLPLHTILPRTTLQLRVGQGPGRRRGRRRGPRRRAPAGVGGRLSAGRPPGPDGARRPSGRPTGRLQNQDAVGRAAGPAERLHRDVLPAAHIGPPDRPAGGQRPPLPAGRPRPETARTEPRPHTALTLSRPAVGTGQLGSTVLTLSRPAVDSC